MKVRVINTGSKGNGYIITSGGKSIALEAGVRYNDAMRDLDLKSLQSVKTLLVSHEHGDHASYINTWSHLHVIASKGTLDALQYNGTWTTIAEAGKKIEADGWYIMPFATIHDSEEPLGFLFTSIESGKVLFATDTASIPIKTTGVKLFMVECNWTLDELNASDVAEDMKARVINTHCGLTALKAFFKEQDLSCARRIILIHTSSKNCDKEFARVEIQALTGVPTIIAEKGKVYDI